MSKLYFQGKINLNSAVKEGDDWRVTLEFTDNEGVFTGNNLTPGDRVIFDLSTFSPGTLGQFELVSIVTADFSSPEVLIRYSLENDGGLTDPDLSWAIGAQGVVVRPSAKLGLLPVAAPGTQLIPDKFSFYLQNYNFKYVLDDLDTEGKSAYEIAVDNGFVGTEAEWLESLQGEDAFADAPTDGKYYVRSDEDWVDLESITFDLGVIEEPAP